MALSAAREMASGDELILEDVAFTSPLVVDAGESRQVQMLVDRESQFRLVSRRAFESAAEWQSHCAGRIAPPAAPRPESADLAWLAGRCPETQERTDFYASIERAGYRTGPNFQCIQTIRKGENQAFCTLIAKDRADSGVIHPGLIDSILQTALPALDKSAATLLSGGRVLIPMHMGAVRLFAMPAGELFCHTQVAVSTRHVKCEIAVFNSRGEVVLEIRDFLLKQTDQATLYRDLRRDDRSLLHTLHWVEARLARSEHAELPTYAVAGSVASCAPALAQFTAEFRCGLDPDRCGHVPSRTIRRDFAARDLLRRCAGERRDPRP